MAEIPGPDELQEIRERAQKVEEITATLWEIAKTYGPGEQATVAALRSMLKEHAAECLRVLALLDSLATQAEAARDPDLDEQTYTRLCKNLAEDVLAYAPDDRIVDRI